MTDGPAARGALPGRCQATIADVLAREQIEQVAAGETGGPVTRIVAGIERVLPRHAAERAVERREVAEPGQRERHEEAVVGGTVRC